MKKKLLFTACIMTTMALSAQSVMTNAPKPMEGLEKSEIKVVRKAQFANQICEPVSSNLKFKVQELNGRTIPNFRKDITPRATEEKVRASYMLPLDDTFHFGMNKEWGLYYPSIILPPAVDVVFTNQSSPKNANCTWTLQGKSPEEVFGEGASDLFKVLPNSNNSYSTNWPINYLGYKLSLTPVVTATYGGTSDSYFYSKGATNNQQTIEKKDIFIQAGGYSELTTTDPIMCSGIYNGFRNEANESKGFGSGQKNSKGEECTGIISVYNKPSVPLVIEGVSIHALPNKEGDSNAVSTDDLTLQVYKVNGTTITNEVIATAECKSVEYSKGAYYITFQFVEDKGLLGTQPSPFTLDQNAAIEIDGFDKCDITMLVVESESPDGHAYGVYPSGLDYVSLEWAAGAEAEGYLNNIADFVMNLNAVYVVLTSGGEEYSLTAPKEGGLAVSGQYNAFGMYSTFPFTDPETGEDNVQIVEAPEWVSNVTIDNSTWGGEGGCYFVFNVTCDPLPTSEKGRAGDIVFETIGGIQTRVHVAQGTTTGIGATKATTINAIAAGDNFELSYSEGITNVTVSNVAGQALATYELPAVGKYTMPASNLSKGMYILKFNNNQTIKVIK